MDELAQLAGACFDRLTTAEQTLLHAVENGEPADCRLDSADSRSRSAWSAPRAIRAQIIRWLFVNKEARERVDVKGVVLIGARLVGKLDFAYGSLNFPLSLIACAVYDGLDFTYTETRLVNLEGSYCGPIKARGAIMRGNLRMSDGFRALGRVDLPGAIIQGDLECGGGRFLNHRETALDAEHCRINGSVLLNLDFRAFGAVNLTAAIIQCDLDCRGGRFLNRGGSAIAAHGARVNGSVLLGSGSRTNAMLVFERAVIGADAVFREARFEGALDNGVDLSRATIGGRLVWAGVAKTPTTRLELGHAAAGQLADEAASWPARLGLDGFTYDTLAAEAADLDSRLKLLGQIRPYLPQPFVQLAQTLQRQGRERMALRVNIAKEDARRRNDHLSPPARGLNWIMGVTTGHGYQSSRVMYVPLFFVLLGWLLFSYGYRANLIAPTHLNAYQQFELHRTLPPQYPEFNALVYTLDTFLPLTDFHQEDYWHPTGDQDCQLYRNWLRCGKVLNTYLGLHILAGWVFAVLGIAGLLVKKY